MIDGVSTDEGFRIAVPTFDMQVKQGEVQTVTVSLHRGGYFKRDVTLRVKASPVITVEPASVSVRAGDTPDVQLRIAATKEAAIGEYRVYVEGTPATGDSTSAEFKVKVVVPQSPGGGCEVGPARAA